MSKDGVQPDILEKLRDQLAEGGFVKRLGAYCLRKTRRRFWYGGSQSSETSMAKGYTPEDIVSQAITKTIAGGVTGEGRIWDGERDLFDYLTSVIDSELSNLAKSAANKELRRAGAMGRVTGEQEDSFLERVPDEAAQTGEDRMLAEVREDEVNAFLEEFLDFLEDDEFLMEIVGLLIEGKKPSAIAEELSVPVEDVYNARKRLRGRLGKFRLMRADKQEA